MNPSADAFRWNLESRSRVSLFGGTWNSLVGRARSLEHRSRRRRDVAPFLVRHRMSDRRGGGFGPPDPCRRETVAGARGRAVFGATPGALEGGAAASRRAGLVPWGRPRSGSKNSSPVPSCAARSNWRAGPRGPVAPRRLAPEAQRHAMGCQRGAGHPDRARLGPDRTLRRRLGLDHSRTAGDTVLKGATRTRRTALFRGSSS